jgi:nucleoside-diphosphate-sugar epimerase
VSRVFITGAAGFIGSHVTRILATAGDEVHAFVRPSTSLWRLQDVRDGIEVHVGDLAHDDELREALSAASPEAAIHLAWYVDPSRYLHAVKENLASLEGSLRLLRLLVEVGCERAVVSGTYLEELKIHTPHTSVYAATKAALHSLLADKSCPINAACAHVFHLFGPYEDRRRVVPSVIRSLLRGQEIDVTKGSQLRDYLFIEDVAGALARLVHTRVTGRVDVCSGSPVMLRELLELVGDETGRRDLIQFGARPLTDNEIPLVSGDPKRLTAATGWRPAWNLRDGIRATVEWWRKEAWESERLKGRDR